MSATSQILLSNSSLQSMMGRVNWFYLYTYSFSKAEWHCRHTPKHFNFTHRRACTVMQMVWQTGSKLL